MQPLVSVIIPTYNSANNLEVLLDSFKKSDNKNFEIIINDDKGTNDNTVEVVKKFKDILKIIYIQENYKMAQARKQWVRYANWDILFHIDSDMKVTEWLIWEIIELMQIYDALIIDEESYWSTFWAKCKWLEKRCYRWIREIESLRVVKKSIYEELDGHNEKMIFSEDKDFDIRVQKKWCSIGRVRKNFLWHNEWNLKLFKTLKKKKWYSSTANIFALEHPNEYKWQINILNRYMIYFKNIKYLFKYPFIYLGMILMKTLEFGAGALGLLLSKFNEK